MGRHVAPLETHYPDRVNQFLLLLSNADVLSGEAENKNCIGWFDQTRT